jgi:transposase InsO family protein
MNGNHSAGYLAAWDTDGSTGPTGPNLKWLTDITEHQTSQGKLYVCLLQDLWSKRIVGYATSDRMTSDLATTALQNAINERRPAGTIVHSDRGSQFRSLKYVLLLNQAGLKGSMGRVGACGDCEDPSVSGSLLRGLVPSLLLVI